MRFTQKIRQYLGLDRPPVLEQYRTSQRNAYLICTTCRAFIDAEGALQEAECRSVRDVLRLQVEGSVRVR
ncbi:hypothetical protein, partial [uncultured Arthrobacter sp.]|uniref:hypothetical protein n=1 Tax=uncultured Arthrobacter sp. TaxID=114050 RepID=UPI00260FC7CB